MTDTKQKKITQIFMDSFIADAVGFSFEGMASEEIKEELLINEEGAAYDSELLVRPHNSGLYDVGTFSDDSEMTINTIRHFTGLEDFSQAPFDINGLAKALAFMIDNDDHANYISPGFACIQALRNINNDIEPPESSCPKGRAGCGALVRVSPLVLSGLFSDDSELFRSIENSIKITHRDERVIECCKAFTFILKRAFDNYAKDKKSRIDLVDKAAVLENVYKTEEIPELLKRVSELSEMELSVLYQEITNIGLVQDGGVHCTYYVIPVLITALVFWVRQADQQGLEGSDTTLRDIAALSGAADSSAFLCAQLCAASAGSDSTFIPDKVRKNIGELDDELIDLLNKFAERCVNG